MGWSPGWAYSVLDIIKARNIPIDANPRLSGRDATARAALQVYRSVVKATIAGSGYDNIQFSPIGA
jgi:hypothetical protein